MIDPRSLDAIIDFPGQPEGPLAFSAPLATLRAVAPDEVPPLLAAAEAHAAQGRWVVGYVGYEAAPGFDEALVVRRAKGGPPVAWFGVYSAPTPLSVRELVWPGAMAAWTPDTSREEYGDGVRRIREGIAAGDFYQVNHTLRMRARLAGPGAALALHARFRRAQPAAYAAYLAPGRWRIVSASPELFFRRRGALVETQPMKGTTPRGRWLEEDRDALARLTTSDKERAENVMIVDLLRNDLGRVAEPGTVDVPALCVPERHPTLWQMTSTVRATARAGTSLADLFAALFPCGSVTGAPKVAAMRAIAALERSPRGAYCGAIGIVRPGGDATFSVAIRTAVVDAETGDAEYGAGGGITWDSTPGAEYDEALAKARVLVTERPDFSLIETMRLEDGVLVRRDAHLARLAESAEYFGFPDPASDATRALGQVAAMLPRGRHRVRLAVTGSGEAAVTTAPVPASKSGPQLVALAAGRVSRGDVFLFHKTTNRVVYDVARAECPEAFDVVLRNEEDELTELTIGNLVVELDGRRWTPPRECGLLAGVYRAALLAAGEIGERVIRSGDLERASGLWLVNSLREWVPVTLERK
jgi:para-aminobenzoate synthetase/4-amino-4-deoxychorismate lyase